MKIAYLGGAWATNIGNSFYNVGLLHVLRELAGAENVSHVPNLASWYWETEYAYDPLIDVDADLFVMSGPCFTRELQMFRPLFERARERGSKVGFVSVGAGTYERDEAASVGSLAEEYADVFAFVSTRDRPTYDLHAGLPCPTFDGVCGSMFLGDAVVVPDLDRPPYVVVNTEPWLEPSLEYVDGEVVVHPSSHPRPKRRGRIGRAVYGRRSSSQLKAQTSVGPYDIVRTQSRPFTADPRQIFNAPSMHYAVIPDGYFAIYKSSDYVVSNRVHTCAATLVLGGRARYLATSGRARDGRQQLLDRVAAGNVRNEWTTLDQEFVSSEKDKLVSWLGNQLNRTA